jgi:hypothetical protein
MVIVAMLLVVNGCSLLGAPEPTVFDEAGMPRPAGIVITADPPVVDRPVELAILTIPEEERLRGTIIPAGTIVRWEQGLSAGPYRVVGPGQACSMDVDLPPERDTDVILSVLDDGCSFRVVEPGAAGPPRPNSGSVLAAVALQPWDGLSVEAVSLDEPRQPVPDPVPPDEGGLAIVEPLYPGRYDIRLRRGDAILETQRITILDRGQPGHLVTLDFDGLPY